MALIETQELEKNLNNFKIIDCSWHMPQTNRDGFEEFKLRHIPNAMFFDLDKNSNKNTDLPHMLVKKKEWEQIVSSMGISNEDKIVIYDNSDVISACRCWFNFIYFGHDMKNVFVLNGGFNKWIRERKTTTRIIKQNLESNYKATEINKLVKTKKDIDKNILEKKFKVIDARSLERFKGEVKEPRAGLKSGAIKNSVCIPFNKLINSNKTFKSKKEVSEIFNETLVEKDNTDLVFSCGSGVTACVLALAYSLINDKYFPKIYDGSWAEYGKF